ncbi:hypothetical protein K470DRAFT_242302 [Piedraia hortae CBS 480.64]|uniref:RING-type domain-containing protein n=1 Tax=Piedraia hortae CBS 480.64 TaxID=1314780 RepID=A0A6A7C8K8_9PEZI|nr:hypothetical protein K470DRAFT_242302 [Piedraia hortae CBS 480.64]
MDCTHCHGLLTVGVDEEGATVSDEIIPQCGHRYHWECFFEASCEAGQDRLGSCPKCAENLLRGNNLLVEVNNEGGHQQNVDILPILHEEYYIHTHPEERLCRAFLELCREGDYRAVAELLKHVRDGMDDSVNLQQVLLYQDPLNSHASALHCAAANGHREIAWLLLLMASTFPQTEMPAPVFQEAAALELMRPDNVSEHQDIRSLRDELNRTAEDVARTSGSPIWHGWIGNGRLQMPGSAGEHGNSSTLVI